MAVRGWCWCWLEGWCSGPNVAQFPPSPGSLTDGETAMAALRWPAAAFERQRPSHLQHAHFLRNKPSIRMHAHTHTHACIRAHTHAPSVSASVARKCLFSFMSTEEPLQHHRCGPVGRLLAAFVVFSPAPSKKENAAPVFLPCPPLPPSFASSLPAFLHRPHHKRIF